MTAPRFVFLILLVFIGIRAHSPGSELPRKNVFDEAKSVGAATSSVGNPVSTFQSTSRRVSRSVKTSTSSNSEAKRTDFLSFNDWNKEKLRQSKSGHQDRSQRPSLRNNHNGDTISDGIEMDFDVFNEEEPEGKIYKDKFNYASVDCAATIMKTNSEAQRAISVLFENKDKSLLNPCSVPNKFVVIELCEDILIQSVVMANFEFFSSTFKTVRFSVAERFPVAKNGWKVLGEFEAENIRNVQEFRIDNPVIWARYLRIEILSYYGNEFYCPITVVRAHGIAMIDEFKQEVQNAGQELEVVIPIEQNAAVANGKCSIPKLLSTNNMSINFDLGLNHQCLASMKHVDFDEFFKGHRGDENITRSMGDTVASIPINTEESIFKNIIKRLSMLETNMTMSILYMEEQSKLLSKSFDKLEETYAQQFESFISAFNGTINTNLISLNEFAQQLRESSVKIIEEQKLSNHEFIINTMHKVESLESAYHHQTRILYLVLFGLIPVAAYILFNRDSRFEEQFIDDGWYSSKPSLQKLKQNIERTALDTSEGFTFLMNSSSPVSSDSEFDDDDSVIISNK